MGQVVAGNIAVNNSPGKLHCDAVIFAVCCNWNSRGARQVKVYLRIVSENCSSLTLSRDLYRNVFALWFEQAATEKAEAQYWEGEAKGRQRKREML